MVEFHYGILELIDVGDEATSEREQDAFMAHDDRYIIRIEPSCLQR